ncbi:MAG TPA: methionine--tRNA ligase [Buchnera sp. (in: enterobacteria)]|nr:methionine--tRNA ligase [Buchnera sp. (in: enterobacteria)]
MLKVKKKILVTCAFPYANGSIHLGHLLEQIQADIWVRFQRMQGNIVWFICSDDSHGTAIMLQSKKKKIIPEKFVSLILEEHKKDFSCFDISHDYYSSTHTKENYHFVKKIFFSLMKKGFIKKRHILQMYDLQENIFLPDRLILGSCPVCFSSNQFGDNCEVCSSIYEAHELINPISCLSKSKPVLRRSKHLFFDLPAFKDMLINWINSGVLSNSVLNKTKEWFATGLKEWNISRDYPYFGFKIPNFSKKYFYVWFDAPIGYISCFRKFCEKKTNISFKEYWNSNDSYLYHFIGKDIIYFHSLFWPAILEGSGFRKPTKIFVHGYVTIKGQKISKSKGSAILAKDWIKYFDSDSIRYFYASKLSSKIEDIEVNLIEIIQKVNSDLVNKVVNLATRTGKIISTYFSNILSDSIDNRIYNKVINASENFLNLILNREYKKAIILVISLANLGNKYVNLKKPWEIVKSNNSGDCNIKEAQLICTTGINIFRVLMIYLKPITTVLAKTTERFLNTKLSWENISTPLLNHKISYFSPIYSKLDKNMVHLLFKK